MIEITLNFHNFENPELSELLFFHPLNNQTRRAVRGKSEGAYAAASGSFQWTAGVQALSLFFVRGAINGLGGSLKDPLLEGKGASAAAALDYAICRSPLWLLDMFGVDSEGGSILRRIVHITNSCRKRVGPVALSLNGMAKKISLGILIENERIKDLPKLILLEQKLAALWPAETCSEALSTRTVVPQDSAVAAPFLKSEPISSKQPGGEGLDRSTFLSILKDEAWRALNITEIFNREAISKDIKYLKKLVARYSSTKPIRRVLSTVDEELIQDNGSMWREAESKSIDIVREFLPLRFLVTPSDFGLIALISYLKHQKELEIDYEIGSWHYNELARKIQSERSLENPSGLVASVRSLSDALVAGYEPYMLSPQVSHFVVAPKHVKQGYYNGALAFSQKPAGTGSLFFEYLQEKLQLERNKVRVIGLAPDEITFLYSNEKLDLKAIMGFPYHNLNAHLNQCTYLTSDQRLIHSNIIFLLLRADIAREKHFVRALDLLLRRAWLALRENFVLLSAVVEKVADDKRYKQSVYRFAGLSHLNTRDSLSMFADVAVAA